MLSYLVFFLNTEAATLIKVNQDEVFKKADYIVSATVKDAECKLEYTTNSQYSYLPYSYITLEVEEIHHNNNDKPIYLNQDLTIRQIGCKKDYKSDSDIILELDGLANLELNTKIFISLNKYKNIDYENYYYVTANEQGKLDYDTADTLIQDLDSSKFIREKNGRIKFINTGIKIKFYNKNSLINLIKTVKGE